MNSYENEPQPEEQKRKPYQKPSIIFEQELEVRAGSPTSNDLFDPLDLNSEN